MSISDAIVQTFRRFDADGNGIIDRGDLLRVLRLLDETIFSEAMVDQMLGLMDKNGDGRIEYAEFVEWVMTSGSTAEPRKEFRMNPRVFLPEHFNVAIEDRYRVDALCIGEGGYGKVFKAWDSRSGRQVAVKQVAKKDSDPATTLTFYREINFMKELDHPNICKLLETFEIGSNIFFVMECCDGGEVFDRIIATGSISEALTADIIRQTVAAIKYTHSRRICHRDLKPENLVFLTREPNDNRVKLIDWGLAITIGDGTVMTTPVGSSTYMAPEVMTASDARPYNEKCDFWSIGVLAYVMICGRPPFWGDMKTMLANARAERYDMINPPWPSVSGHAKDFICRLIKCNPDSRMGIEDCSRHAWLNANTFVEDPEAQRCVLQNMKRFVNTGLFTSMCITAVARQLDHKRLHSIHNVFRSIDKNSDGYLSIGEVQEGFKALYGEHSEEFLEIDRTFKGLDIDGSGIIDYTEFCAAALGEHTAVQEEAIWAAFKTFDIDNSNTISIAELKKILENADVRRVWTPAVCEQVAAKMLYQHDMDGDGAISYNEWLSVMRKIYYDNMPPEPNAAMLSADVEGALAASAASVYGMLVEVSKLPPIV